MKRSLDEAFPTNLIKANEEALMKAIPSQGQTDSKLNCSPPRHKKLAVVSPCKSVLEMPSNVTSCLSLEFVDRETEADLIVSTLARNRSESNLSTARLVSLFQTCGIGKTLLVRNFREVYSQKHNGIWLDECKWIKDLKLLEIDFRFFKLKSGSTVSDMGVEIANFVTDLYYEQFIQRETGGESDLLERRKEFHLELQQAANEGRRFYSTFNHNVTKEGYLLFFDEVEHLLNYNLDSVDLQDKNWPKDCYMDRFLYLWKEILPLLVSQDNAVIFSGHIPVHLSLDRSHFKTGSPLSDYCLVFLSPMSNHSINKMLTQSHVTIDGQPFSLLSILKLLGLTDVNEFIEILREYSGTVPRIMENLLKSFISKRNDLSTKDKICEACEQSDQKRADITVCIENEEEAELLSHFYSLHALRTSIPVKTVSNISKINVNIINNILASNFQKEANKSN